MEKINWTLAHSFIFLEFTFQLLLLIPGIGFLRFPIRIGAFMLSILLLVLLRSKSSQHPSAKAAILVMIILLLEFCLHPDMNSITGGLAQCAMYLAILAPLFWVRSLKITPVGFESLVFIIWVFHSISSIFGVLQVYYPGKFQPPLAEMVKHNAFHATDLLITLASGEQVYRPMGLTDTPGGAGNSGFYAFLLGVGIALKIKNPILRIICMGSAILGLFCIYLSQIRSILILCAVSMIFLAIVFIRTGQITRLVGMVSTVTTLFIASFSWATAVGGKRTSARFASLTANSADKVYHDNRGEFLESTYKELLPQYPLGAGLGRWGMINGYFGDNTDAVSQPIWVEIQWTAWLLDGGVPLIFAYVWAIYSACHTAWKIATNSKLGDFTLWGGLIFAYDVGNIVISFGYPVFLSQGGMEFWLLNTVLFVAASNSQIATAESSQQSRRRSADR